MMTRIYLLFLFALLTACSSKKNAAIAPQAKDKDLKGEWVVTSITYGDDRDHEVRLFQDALGECFLDSKWRLISNNNKGTYTIDGINCTGGTRNFIWTYDPSTDKVIIKPTDEKYKSATGTGYSLFLKTYNENSFTLSQDLRIEGSPVAMDLNFVRANNQ